MYKKQGINNNNDYLTLYFSFRALKAKKEKKSSLYVWITKE